MASSKDKKVVSMDKKREENRVAYNRALYGEVIRTNRAKAKLTQARLAEILKVPINYVSNWEIGFSRPDMNLVPELCHTLGISIATLFGCRSELEILTPEERDHLKSYSLLSPRDRGAVNALTEHLLMVSDAEYRSRCRNAFLGLFHNENMAAAGSINMLGDAVDGETEFIRRNEITERADEIVTVTGDSMEPTFYEGDDLLVQHTETLEIGEIGIIIINGEGFVKEFRGNGVYSHNEAAYPFRKFGFDDDVRIVGRVLGKVTRDMRPNREETAILNELQRDGSI